MKAIRFNVTKNLENAFQIVVVFHRKGSSHGAS